MKKISKTEKNRVKCVEIKASGRKSVRDAQNSQFHNVEKVEFVAIGKKCKKLIALGGEYDAIVAGGGVVGVPAALASARLGCKVLIKDEQQLLCNSVYRSESLFGSMIG